MIFRSIPDYDPPYRPARLGVSGASSKVLLIWDSMVTAMQARKLENLTGASAGGEPALKVHVGDALQGPRLVNSASLRTEYIDSLRTIWMRMNYVGRACFTPCLMKDVRLQQRLVASSSKDVDFLVVASEMPGVFNLGGDLDLFRRMVISRDRENLLAYATDCIEGIYFAIDACRSGIVTIALVEGEALGGGLECALSCDIVVAERGVKMGFPEMMFNMFPGMGAYPLILRRAAPHIADELIAGAQIVTSERLHELGLIDHLAEPGQGERVVRRLIAQIKSKHNGYIGYLRAKRHSPYAIQYEELLRQTEEWVDCALGISDRDLRLMELLVESQDRRRVA